MANRRSILGHPVVATASTDAFGLLQISPTQAEGYSYLSRIQSLQDALSDLNAHAAVSTSDHNLTTTTQHAIRIGSVWRLVDKHDGDWTADVGPDQTLKLSDLIEITLPTGRSAPALTPEQRAQVTDGKIHQRYLVAWEPVGTGQTVPPPTERNGKLQFRYLRQPQRAMLVNYSVPHLTACARIFDQRDRVTTAVKWVHDRIADGTLTGKPRKSEGIEYVADCLRVHRAYLAGRDARDGGEAEGIARAQTAIAPRGGARTGLGAIEVRNRLFALSIHLLATTARLGIQSPFARLFRTPKDLDRWIQMSPYSEADSTAWGELQTYGNDASFASMTFPGAGRLYTMPLPAAPEGTAAETHAVDTMTDEQVKAANLMGESSISVPAVAWWDIPTRRAAAVLETSTTTVVETRSGSAYNTEARALGFGRRANPNASTEDENAGEYLTAERNAPPSREGGEMRWVWLLRRRVGGGDILYFTGSDIPPEQIERTRTPEGRPAGSEFFVFTPTGEPEQVGEHPRDATEDAVKRLREERTTTGAIIIRFDPERRVNVLLYQTGNFERVVMPANQGEQPQAPATA